MDIQIIREKISENALAEITKNNYGNMVKGVIDLKQKVIALGGELHADAEAVLLKNGSQQENLWGFNVYTDKPRDKRIEYTSFINIRPSQDNRSIELKNAELCDQIRMIVESLVE